MKKSLIWRQRFGFGAADMASNLVWAMITTYLTVFYTDVVGLDLVIVGTITLASKVIDAFVDIFMGIIVDHTNTRWGKCRPYFLFGAIPFGIFAIITFIAPHFGDKGQILYAFITFNLVGIGYTIVNTPLSAILPSLTSEKNERNILVTFRMIMAAIGSFCVTAFTLPLVDALGGGDTEKGYMLTVMVFTTIAVVLFFFTFGNVREVVKPTSEKSEKVKIKDGIKAINKQYVLFITIMFIFLLGFAIKQAGVVYYFTYTLERVDLISIQAAITSVSMIVGQLCIPIFSKRFGKKSSMYIMGVIALIGNAFFVIGRHMGIVFILVGTAVVWFALGFMMGMRFSLLADVVDYSEMRSGIKAAGMLSSLDSFVAKLTFGLNVTIFTGLMSLGHYVPNQHQTPQSILCINIGFIGIPVLCLIVMIVLLRFFNVEDYLNKHQKNELASEEIEEVKELEEVKEVVEQA